MAYYTIQNNNILIAENREILENQSNNVYELPSDYVEGKYIIDGDVLVLNPNYEQEEEEKEKERISHLKCTKRVLVLILEQLGLDYFNQIEPLINANRQARLEWELCVELERNNPLLDIIGGELGLTTTDIDNIFKYANGEIETITREVI